MNFNPRSHKGNDTQGCSRQKNYFHFNPRSHKGNDPRLALVVCHINLFQSTFPQGERRSYVTIAPPPFHFNPRSHKGNDHLCHLCIPLYMIFQSTFPQGERRPRRTILCIFQTVFQSTFPQGERLFHIPNHTR